MNACEVIIALSLAGMLWLAAVAQRQRKACVEAFAQGLEQGLEIGRKESAFARSRREGYAYRRGQRDAWVNSN